jgi:ABC-type spermidine/putrescine transport systems, ATPase components
MSEPYLDIHIVKLYPEFQLQVSLGVEKGELHTLIGPSGCGKTTLLRLIAGLETPDQGSIRLAGKDITDIPAVKRRVGMVFQDYALFPHLSAAQNIEYGLQVLKIPQPQRKQKLNRLLALFELETLAGRQIHQLSGGERQRVAFARALAPEPLVLLMDEPFSALDYGLRQRLQKDLRQIQKDLGFTAIFVTHQQEEALSLSDHLAVMQNGTILQAGTPLQIYDKPLNSFVAEFLGDANLIPCSLEKSGRKTRIKIEPETFLEFSGWDDYPDGNYLLMIRPEDLQIQIANPVFQVLEVQVTAIEYLGHSYRLEALCGRHKIKAFIAKNVTDIRPGMKILLGIDPRYIRLITP